MNPAHIYVVISRPVTAGNIGAVARAMKNMGFSRLRLVAPRRNWKTGARLLARSASNILESAEIFPTLEEALSDLHWSFGTTGRISQRRGKFVAFDDFIAKTSKKSAKMKIAVVFGCEDDGLSNDEIEVCDQLVSIPADEAYPSLNLSQAAMVTLFSLARKRLKTKSKLGLFAETGEPYLDKAGVQSAMQHFAEALECLGFYGGKDGRRDKIVRVMQAAFKRAGMLHREAQMLKGVSARIIERTKK